MNVTRQVTSDRYCGHFASQRSKEAELTSFLIRLVAVYLGQLTSLPDSKCTQAVSSTRIE